MENLLKPELIQTLEGLELLSRQIVNGYLAGTNQSIKSGQGQAFMQYRSYQPGDDLRQLDWKMFARSDRYYVKEAEVETNIRIKLLIDCSRSMLHQDAGLSKLDYAKVMAASFTYLARLQGDAIGLYALGNQQTTVIPVKEDRRHFQRMLFAISQLTTGARFPAASTQKALFGQQKQGEMTIVLTDLYEHGEEIRQTIRTLVALRQEVVVCHLLGENERTLSYKGTPTFEDLETGKTLQVNTRQQRQQYRQVVAHALEKLKRDFQQLGADYQLFSLHQPIGLALAAYLKRRKRFI